MTGRRSPGPAHPRSPTSRDANGIRILEEGGTGPGLLRVTEERALVMIHAAGTGTVLALLEVPPDQRDLGLSDAMFDAVTGGILATRAAVHDTDLNAVAVMFAIMVSDLSALTDAERTLRTEWITRSVAELQGA